ncbi:MAG: restriction endonuclease subunit S [Candidatus Binatia bacterium]
MKWYGEGVHIHEEKEGQEFEAARFEIRKGDLIYNDMWARKGSVAVVPENLSGCVASSHFPTFELDRNRVDPLYLRFFFRTPTFWEACELASRGSTGRNQIKRRTFLAIQVPLPPLPEQRRVVARIAELAADIHEARALRQQAAEGAETLVAARTSALFDDDICWRRVQDAVSTRKGAVRSGPFGSQLLHEEFTTSGVAAIGTRDVRTNRFQLQGGWFVSPEKFEQFRRYQVFSGDVLCTIVGASIGRFCVVPENAPLAFTTKHVQALTLDPAKAEPRFASMMLNFHRRCRESLFSQVEGSAQPSLNARKILATALPLPPLPEQRRSVSELDALQAEVEALKRLQAETAAELDALLPSILDRAFRGEL